MAVNRISPGVSLPVVGGKAGRPAYPNRLLADLSKFQAGGQLAMAGHTKRERSQNWGHLEKCVLVELVQQRLDVIENKASDTDAIRRRKQAWKNIHAEFASRVEGSGVQRDVQRMREQWRRIKHWAKQEMKYFRETEELEGNHGLKKPNEFAQYICEMMRIFEQSGGSLPRLTTPDNLPGEVPQEEVQDAEESSSSTLPMKNTPDSLQELIGTSDTTGASNDVVPVSLGVIPVVKQEPESVQLLDSGEDGVTMVTASSNFAPSPTQPMPHLGRVDADRTSIKKSTLPNWTRGFSEMVGDEGVTQGAIYEGDEDDEDESDFLDDSEEEDLGSLSDLGRDIPAGGRGSFDGPRQGSQEPSDRLEKQRMSFARREFKRRMQMMEAEHARKMQILDLQRETAQLKKKLVLRQLKQRRSGPAPSTNSYSRHGHVQR